MVLRCSNRDNEPLVDSGYGFETLAFPLVFGRLSFVTSGRDCPGDRRNTQMVRDRGFGVKPHEDDAAAWFRSEEEAHVRVAHLGTAERRLELNMSDDRIRLQHEVVTTVVDCGFNTQACDAREPQRFITSPAKRCSRSAADVKSKCYGVQYSPWCCLVWLTHWDNLRSPPDNAEAVHCWRHKSDRVSDTGSAGLSPSLAAPALSTPTKYS